MACSSAAPPSTPGRRSPTACSPTSPARSATGISAPPTRSTAAGHASFAERHSAAGLHHLERRLRLDLEGVHGRSALHRHQPEQGRLQRLHRRSHRDVQTVGRHGDQHRATRSNWCGAPLRRPALGRPDGQHQPQVSRTSPILSRAVAERLPPVSFWASGAIPRASARPRAR